MIAAVTGATGFVGQAVLDAAAGEGRMQVRALTRRAQTPRAGVEWVRGDLADEGALAQLVEGADAVLHIAGVVNAPDRAGFVEGNVHGTERLVAAARSAAVPRFVLVSSLAAREPQLSDYGRTKLDGEQIVRESGLDFTIVRPPAVYGPRDTEILQLFRAARWGVVPMPPAGRTSIIHVADLARLLLALLPSGDNVSGRCFEPDDARPGGWSHVELGRAIGRAAGHRVWTPNIPRPLLAVAARLDRVVRGGRAKLTPDRASYLAHPDWTCRAVAAVPTPIWTPAIGTPEGLAATARWYREQGWL